MEGSTEGDITGACKREKSAGFHHRPHNRVPPMKLTRVKKNNMKIEDAKMAAGSFCPKEHVQYNRCIQVMPGNFKESHDHLRKKHLLI